MVSKITQIISICGFIVVLVLGTILISNSNERVERAHEEVERSNEALEKARADLDNVVRSQIQKCIEKSGPVLCVGVALDYKKNGCEIQDVYADLPVCNDGTLDNYIEQYEDDFVIEYGFTEIARDLLMDETHDKNLLEHGDEKITPEKSIEVKVEEYMTQYNLYNLTMEEKNRAIERSFNLCSSIEILEEYHKCEPIAEVWIVICDNMNWWNEVSNCMMAETYTTQ